MTFYGSTFPNETHNETLLSGRQRFGNRSANMFFVRPARHIACPQRLKYMQDITTGYVPYVEDAGFLNRPPYRHVLQKASDEDMNKTNGFGLYNSADSWRQELMELAQQVKSSFGPADELEQYNRQSRSPRSNKHRNKRSSSSVSIYQSEDNDEQNLSKRLLNRRVGTSYRRSQVRKAKNSDEKSEQEPSTNDENQDAGIWLIPILCYILQIDNILEAQDWLVSANPTEKRLAMELISRTMQDMQTFDNDLTSDVSTSDQTSTSLNNAYWPYKVLQRQEKERQLHSYIKQAKLSSSPSLPSLTVDNGDTCERATSPLRMLTPANKRPPTSNHLLALPIETTVIERSTPRNANDRATPTIVVRQNQSQMTDRSSTAKQHSSSRIPTPRSPNGADRLSRRGYRITTSLNNSTDDSTHPISPTLRGKTPLI